MLVWPETQLWNVCRPTCSIPGPSHTMCRTSIFKQRTEHARTQCEARPDTREGGRERSKRSKQKHRENQINQTKQSETPRARHRRTPRSHTQHPQAYITLSGQSSPRRTEKQHNHASPQPLGQEKTTKDRWHSLRSGASRARRRF